MSAFRRTEKAAAREQADAWAMVEAIAIDAEENGFHIVGIDSQVEAYNAFVDAGNEKAESTIQKYCVLAKFDHESTARQREVWRRYGTGTVLRCAAAGWSQEATNELLAGRTRKSEREVLAAVRKASTRVRAHPADLRSLDQKWGDWVAALNGVLTEGARLAEQSEKRGVELGAQAELGLALYARFSDMAIEAEAAHGL